MRIQHAPKNGQIRSFCHFAQCIHLDTFRETGIFAMRSVIALPGRGS